MRLFRESEHENRRAPKGKANNINTVGTQKGRRKTRRLHHISQMSRADNLGFKTVSV